MATKRKAAIPDFSALVIDERPAAPVTPAAAPEQEQERTAPAGKRRKPRAAGGVKENAAAVLMYLDPAGHKALKLYGVEAGRKVHDLLLEAVEDWSKKHGIREPMRLKGGG